MKSEIPDKASRIYEFWIAKQKSGKTTVIRARIRALINDPNIKSIWVLDRLEEFPGNLDYEFQRYGKFSDYLADAYDEEDSGNMPQLILWQMGENPENYREVFREAMMQGDILLVLDEASEFSPAGPGWRGSTALRSICLRGRHLQTYDGELARTHLIIATQYPRMMNHLLWDQSENIYCGIVSGELNLTWVKQNFGKEALEAVEAQKRFEFTEIQWYKERGFENKLPPLPGYGVNG